MVCMSNCHRLCAAGPAQEPGALLAAVALQPAATQTCGQYALALLALCACCADPYLCMLHCKYVLHGLCCLVFLQADMSFLGNNPIADSEAS